MVSVAAAAAVALALSGWGGTTPAVAQEPDPVGGPRLGEPGLAVNLAAGVPAPPALAAACYLLADLDSGDVVLAKCAHAKGLPASTMKVLTALALVPRLDPARVVLAAHDDAAVDGTKVGLQPGYGYTVDQLTGAMLIGSANDAANALARANGGMAATAVQMNEVAAGLGARDTLAVNTSGLDASGQTTSVYDLALIGRAALADPVVAGYVRSVRRDLPGHRIRGKPGARATYEVSNHNDLLFSCPGTIGVKNGFTNAAGHTLIAAVRRGTRGYLLSYLGMAKRDWKTPAALMEWAFAHGSQVSPIGRLVSPGTPADPADGLPARTDPGNPSVIGATPLVGTEPAAPATPTADAMTAARERIEDPTPRWALTGFVVLLLGLAVWRRRTLRAGRQRSRTASLGRSPGGSSGR
ncbi:MAG TPA: serine hydrolase [Dermatophilaceae bacterium]|nr:serine hydrolase [Dermatophilaceae bacterium]